MNIGLSKIKNKKNIGLSIIYIGNQLDSSLNLYNLDVTLSSVIIYSCQYLCRLYMYRQHTEKIGN